MIKKICKCILIYAIFYLASKFIFSSILYIYRCDSNIMFWEFIYCQYYNKDIEISSSFITGIICLTQNVIDVSATAVLTSFIFTYILNKEPTIIFPDKLVIRHRTSWEKKNKITLGILVGNKNRYNIHNAVCSITCSYIKQENPLLINCEYTLKEERILLQNYYRFSFDLNKFPRQILKDIIEKPVYYDKETIVVSIAGNCNYLGNSFKVSREYKLSDIVYDEHTPHITFVRKNIFTRKDLKNPFTGKTMLGIDWNELTKIVEADEIKRSISVNEIRYIIKNKKKIKKDNRKRLYRS